MKNDRKRLAILLILCLLASACSPGLIPGQTSSPTSPTASSLPAASNTESAAAAFSSSLEPTAQPASSGSTSDPVSAACDPARQEPAMRQGQIPDWGALNLSACYQLSIQLDPENAGYTGSAHVTYVNQTQDEQPDLVFRIYPNSPGIYGGSLEVTSAQVNLNPVSTQVFLPDHTGLRIQLPSPLQPGESAVVELEFQGTTPRDLQGTSLAYGVFNTTTDPETMTLANWYPILDDWQDGDWKVAPVIAIGDAVVSTSALYEVDIIAPSDWQIAATGSQVAESQVGQDLQRSFVSGPTRDFMITASPSYHLIEKEIEGVNVRAWGLPDGKDRWSEAQQAAADALQAYNEQFGAYPFAELDIVAAPLQLALGVEYPGLVLIQDTAYLPDAEQPFLLGLVIAHEVAHQWWYSVVGNDVLENPWQDEALATFSSLLYQEQYQPRYYLGTLSYYQQNVQETEKEDPLDAVGQPVEAFTDRPQSYSRYVYQKGALFLEAVRGRIGDQEFLNGLQSYYRDYQYQIASPTALLDAFETSCACQLDDLYTQWGVH
jgi:hypothetical protein